MKPNAKKARLLLYALMMLIIILDTATAVNAAFNAIELCIKTVIPGVFPFLLLSGAIAAEIKGYSLPLLERIVRIPSGTAGYFLIGLLCGYPVGAKMMHNAVESGWISKPNARRMISFCNNASPAFIIGILSSVFANGWVAILLWLIQISASLLLGILLPGGRNEQNAISILPNNSAGKTMTESLRAMATICGWVTIFAIILAYIKNALMSSLGIVTNTLICGLIELTNGLHLLAHIQSPAIRFTVSAVLLSFGGICVLMQTKSVAPSVELKPYIFARILHAGISGFISAVAGIMLFPTDRSCLPCIPLFLCFTVLICLTMHFNKKTVAIGENV